MMKHIAVVAAALLGAPALVQESSEEQMTRIGEVLAGMKCEVGPANVQVEDGSFDLDDVICADGQQHINLDAGHAVTERRKE